MQEKKLKANQLSYSKANGSSYKVLFIEQLDELYDVPCPEPHTVHILGNGTNTLFLNHQHSTILSLKKFKNYEFLSGKEIYCEAGVLLPTLINQLAKQGYLTLEHTYPVPATLGGAIAQNFGAFGKKMEEFLNEVTYFDFNKQRFHTLTNFNGTLFYRDSIFKKMNFLIVSAKIKLKKTDPNNALKVINDIAEKRNKLPFQKTLGSIFLNPNEKTSAGELLDKLGAKKFIEGDASVSEHHANIFVNNGKATAKEIYNLVKKMQSVCQTELNISLQPEIVLY